MSQKLDDRTAAETHSDSHPFFASSMSAQQEFPAPPSGSCCLCSENPHDQWEYVEGDATAIRERCETLNNQHHGSMMQGYAESDQSCSNACAVMLSGYSDDPFFKVEKELMVAPPESIQNIDLQDICACGTVKDDHLSLLETGIETDSTMYTYHKWDRWASSFGSGEASRIMGISNAENETCMSVCNATLAMPHQDAVIWMGESDGPHDIDTQHAMHQIKQ